MGQVTQMSEMYNNQLLMVENWVLAAICSAFGCGLLVLLYVKCMVLVWNKQSQRSRGMRYFLLTYMTTMMSLSLIQTTATGVFVIGSVRRLVAQVGSEYFSLEKAECLYCQAVEIVVQVSAATVNWGMDGFMIWRCMVLYRDLPRLSRLALCTFAFALGGASLASGILFIVPSLAPGQLSGIKETPWRPVIGPLSFFASVTLFINIAFTALISVRLWLHRSRLQKILGPGYGSIYRRVVIILSESAAVVVVANIVMIVLLFLFPAGSTPVACSAVHIYAASPLIILYRIHSDRDVVTEISNFNVTRQLEQCVSRRSQLEPLQFATSNTGSPEAVVPWEQPSNCLTTTQFTDDIVHPASSSREPATINSEDHKSFV
ncbi:hypothetical protein BJ165DRAFT_1134124 [Panaeolus papilionaceus]|nr:hypothetical protein BJ165DRAFT_1134124 [Panaeolus papilionaceus]